MLQELQDGFDKFAPDCIQLILCTDATDAEHTNADKVLVLLSDGVLAQSVLVESLEQSLRADQEQDLERICVVYDENSWSFGCPAQQTASDGIRNCLESHEALTFRPKASEGDYLRHESPAMVRRLLHNMQVYAANQSAVVAAEQAAPPTPSGPHGSDRAHCQADATASAAPTPRP